MCCTIRGDLEKGLLDILDSIKKGQHIDAIMIETTGMADPVPIVRTFMNSNELTQELRLDGVLTVADAKNLPQRLDEKVDEEGKVNEAWQQIAFADKILLNKIDLVSTDEAISIKDKIRDINKFAKVVPSVKGRIQLSELSNMRAHDMGNFVNADIDQEAAVAPEFESGHGGHGGHGGHDGGHASHGGGHEEGHGGHGGHGGGHEEGHGGHGGHGGHVADGGHSDGHSTHGESEGHGLGHVAKKSRHDSRINSFSIVREGEIIGSKLSAWMESIGKLPAEKGKIFRIKAILPIKGHPYKHVFHAVMDQSDEDDAGLWKEGERKLAKIVFIGKSMDRKFITDGFMDIFEPRADNA